MDDNGWAWADIILRDGTSVMFATHPRHGDIRKLDERNLI